MEQAFSQEKAYCPTWTVTALSAAWETCDGMTCTSYGTFVGIIWKEVISVCWIVNLYLKNLLGK